VRSRHTKFITMMLNGNALPQIEPPSSGIHLFWMGPSGWVYSPGGWNVQRRLFTRRPSHCEAIGTPEIARIRIEREWRFSFGWLSYRNGLFDEVTPAEVFRLDLDKPTTFIRLNIQAKLGFSYALYRGKVVSTITPKNSGSFFVEFMATAIDAIVSYLLDPQTIQYCVHQPEENEEQSWNDVPFIVKGLQLPIAGLDPSLHNPDEEFEKAKSRLLPGEDIDPAEFKQLVESLRPTVKTNSYPRHIDKILLLRAEETTNFEELNATAPLLSLISHPKWRRIMGFGWFDQDSALLEGQSYEYRITGFFPIEDLNDRVYGFHTISSNTALPASFFLGDLMLRFSQPPRVELAQGTLLTGMQQLSRRGIVLQIPDQFFWPFPVLQNWSVVMDFPHPIKQVQLELQQGQALEYEAWDYNDVIVSGQPLPPGEIVKIDFPAPIVQLRLKGSGFLFTIRITQPLRGLKPVSVVLPPVLFSNHPRAGTPAFFEAKNLQEIAAANTQDNGIATSAARSALGFRLEWEASLQNGLTYWPPGETTAPPIESTLYQIEHRQLPSLNWSPILNEENWIIGHRRRNEDKAAIKTGVDLMQLFPEMPTAEVSTNQRMSLDDVFDFSIENEPIQRPLPQLGTSHQYRIRAIDIIGRPGDNWQESNQVELQKLLPPPLPVGPIPVVDDILDFASPSGAHARLLVKDAPDLTPEEITLLGSDNNLIILKWGWHKEQRDLDPYAKEFRIYRRNQALDSIPGQLLSVVDLGNGRFEGSFQLESPIRANAVKNSFIELGGYPFYVQSHEAGNAVKMLLERRIPDAHGQLSAPPTGNVNIPILIGSDRLQPQGWSARIGVVPITDSTAYSFELRNALDLSVTHTRDELWIGVSASDDQPYVEDKLAPTDNRKGNESPIVPVRVQGRFQGRPQFDIPPPMEDVPRLLTREPETGPIRFEVNVADFLEPGTLSVITHIRLERTDAGTVFNQYRVTSDNRVMAVAPSAAQPDAEVTIPNPDDKNNIIEALRKVNASGLADRYLVFLAGSHPYRATFFEPVTANPVNVGIIADSFLPQTNRFVYRIRTGNAAGLISEGDAMLEMVVRVPSLKPGPVPEFIPREKNTPPGLIQLRIAPDENITHVVVFYAEASSGTAGPPSSGSLLRIANRPDLYPDKLLRFRTPAGDFARQFINDLSGSDVTEDEHGAKTVSFELEEAPGSSWRIWACTLTGDGIPCSPAGPWRLLVPVG
jgi:hypothetical protein